MRQSLSDGARVTTPLTLVLPAGVKRDASMNCTSALSVMPAGNGGTHRSINTAAPAYSRNGGKGTRTSRFPAVVIAFVTSAGSMSYVNLLFMNRIFTPPWRSTAMPDGAASISF